MNNESEIPSGKDICVTSSHCTASFKAIEESLGYSFNNHDWLVRALTHSSTNDKHSVTENYERLEFLGDAVLGLAMAQLLLDNHKDLREGQLSKMRAALVNTKSLAEIAQNINIGQYIKLSRSQLDCGGTERPALLADVMEAIFGAIYRDSGFDAALKCIQRLYGDLVATVRPNDPKTDLQEALHEYITDPQALKYELESAAGPEHQPTFTSLVKIYGTTYGRGSGVSKKESQQAAAAEALRILNESDWQDFKQKQSISE